MHIWLFYETSLFFFLSWSLWKQLLGYEQVLRYFTTSTSCQFIHFPLNSCNFVCFILNFCLLSMLVPKQTTMDWSHRIQGSWWRKAKAIDNWHTRESTWTFLLSDACSTLWGNCCIFHLTRIFFCLGILTPYCVNKTRKPYQLPHMINYRRSLP